MKPNIAKKQITISTEFIKMAFIHLFTSSVEYISLMENVMYCSFKMHFMIGSEAVAFSCF